jgi:hypothetical protein
VLSSLRKQRKGKTHAAETVGCTVDTFAEQVVIYLIRAVEARVARRPVQTPTPEPEPEPTHETQTETTESPAEAGQYIHEPPNYVHQPQNYVHGPQNDERHLDAYPTADGLPTIEQLSATTPAVPEPVRSVETRMDTITALVPAVSAIELPPAAPINTSVNAIAAIERNHAIRAQDCPAPAALPRVAQLFMEVRSLERAASGHVVHTLPAPAPTGIERVEALVPIVKSAAATPSVPVPALPPRVAELATQLLRVEADSHVHGTEPLPALPTGSVEMSMAAVAAMVPVSAAVSERILPTPSVVSPMAELRMELPPVTAAGDAVLPIVPESGESASVAALAAMASVVRTIGVDRPLAAPAATLPTADLPMTLMPAATTLATQTVAPVVPESFRSNGMSTKVVASIVPLAAADQAHTLAQIPATATRVAELSMQVLSHGIDADTPVLPELPTGPTDASADAVAAITPLARAAAHHGFVPVPTVASYVVELPIQLPPMAAPSAPQSQVLAVPQASPAMTKADVAAAPVAEVPALSPREAQTAPALADAPSNVHRKAKKKPTLQERKAARKNGRKADRLDDVSIFDPDECRFAALVAKLDEVVLRSEEAHASGASDGQRAQSRKPARSGKNKH